MKKLIFKYSAKCHVWLYNFFKFVSGYSMTRSFRITSQFYYCFRRLIVQIHFKITQYLKNKISLDIPTSVSLELVYWFVVLSTTDRFITIHFSFRKNISIFPIIFTNLFSSPSIFQLISVQCWSSLLDRHPMAVSWSYLDTKPSKSWKRLAYIFFRDSRFFFRDFFFEIFFSRFPWEL